MFLIIRAYAEGWVTINGVHVYIGAKGTVTKGPANLMGKNFTEDVTDVKTHGQVTTLKHKDGNDYKVRSKEYTDNLETAQRKLDKAIKTASPPQVELAKTLVGKPREVIYEEVFKAQHTKGHPMSQLRNGRGITAVRNVERLVELFENAQKVR